MAAISVGISQPWGKISQSIVSVCCKWLIFKSLSFVQYLENQEEYVKEQQWLTCLWETSTSKNFLAGIRLWPNQLMMQNCDDEKGVAVPSINTNSVCNISVWYVLVLCNKDVYSPYTYTTQRHWVLRKKYKYKCHIC